MTEVGARYTEIDQYRGMDVTEVGARYTEVDPYVWRGAGHSSAHRIASLSLSLSPIDNLSAAWRLTFA